MDLRRIPKLKKFSEPTKNHTISVANVLVISPLKAICSFIPSAAGLESITNSFKALFLQHMMDLIVEKTNLKINYVVDNTPPESKKLLSDKYTYLKTTDLREMYAFIGLLYTHGLLGLDMHSMEILFSSTVGHSIFTSTTSKLRFTFLPKVISFFDDGERRQNWKSDFLPLHKLSQVSSMNR